jgi:hypothetical protein
VADTKVSALTELATPVGGDLLAVIDDPAGTPISKKVTIDNVLALVPAAGDAAAGKIEIAVQSEMEAGTDATRAVTPGRQHFHPSAAKFWVQWTGNSTTILSSYNMTSIADTGVGDADGTIATDFSSANWAASVDTQDTTLAWDAANVQGSGFNAKAAGTFGVLCSTITDGGTAVASLTDPDQWCVIGFGDHA